MAGEPSIDKPVLTLSPKRTQCSNKASDEALMCKTRGYSQLTGSGKTAKLEPLVKGRHRTSH